MATRNNYQVNGNTLDELLYSLNFHMQSIADRLDKIEGIRGTSNIESNLDMNENAIQNIGSLTASGALTSGSATTGALVADSLTLAEPGWRDLTADMAAGKVQGANVPSWGTVRDSLNAYSFSASATNELWLTFHPDHDFARDSSGNYYDMYPHIHWTPGASGSSNTGTVRWGFEYSFGKPSYPGENISQDGFPASQTIYMEETLTGDTSYKHIVTEASDAQAIGSDFLQVDGLLLVRIFRDGAHANDTYGAAVFGLTCDLHYRSAQLVTPNKRPPFF